MFTIYAIKSMKRKFIYVGFTKSIKNRLKQHQKGHVRSTKPYRPFVLIFTETCNTRIEARKREKELKSGYGKEFLKALIYDNRPSFEKHL